MAGNDSTTQSRFVFRGNAVPLGGRVVRIGDQRVSRTIQSPAASSLSVVGGASHSTAAGSKFDDIFSWGECLADSTGEIAPDGSTKTTVTASIMNVSASNRPITFQTDVLKVTVVSTHPTRGQPSIVPTEVVFYKKAMTLNKLPILLDVDLDLFQKLSTMQLLDQEFKSNRKFYERFVERFKRVRNSRPEFGSSIPRVGGYVSSSIVSGITYGGKKISGNVLKLDGFGSIYFGEVLINEYNRRLTLVRLGMGSSVEASVAYAEVDPNGSWN